MTAHDSVSHALLKASMTMSRQAGVVSYGWRISGHM